MKPTQKKVIAWAEETCHYTDYEDGKDNEQFKVWGFTYQGLQDAFTLAYEAGRADENEKLNIDAECCRVCEQRRICHETTTKDEAD